MMTQWILLLLLLLTGCSVIDLAATDNQRAADLVPPPFVAPPSVSPEGCEFSEFGCCPDGSSAAPDADGIGCPQGE